METTDKTRGKYNLLTKNDNNVSFDSDQELRPAISNLLYRPRPAILLQLLLFVSSMTMFGLSLFINKAKWHGPATCGPADLSVYSPVFDKLPITLSTTRVNGTFWGERTPSLFQQLPNPEVDEAWDRVSEDHAVAISLEELKKIGRDPQESWPWLESDAGKPGQFMGLVDIFHQTHCLNLLRKAAFGEYYNNIREVHKHDYFPIDQHLLHCQYILLQALTCHADLEIITFNKVKGNPGPFADFNVEKKCRNFDDILIWKEKNQVHPQDREKWIATPPNIREVDNVGVAIPFPAQKSHSHSKSLNSQTSGSKEAW